MTHTQFEVEAKKQEYPCGILRVKFWWGVQPLWLMRHDGEETHSAINNNLPPSSSISTLHIINWNKLEHPPYQISTHNQHTYTYYKLIKISTTPQNEKWIGVGNLGTWNRIWELRMWINLELKEVLFQIHEYEEYRVNLS